MSFTSLQLLERQLGQQFVQSINSAHPEVLEQVLIPQADRIITRKTGKQPPDDPSDDGDEQLALYASWLILYALIPLQSNVGDSEVNRRTGNYDRAMRELEAYEDVTVDSSFAAEAADYESTKRVGDLP